MKFDIVLAGTPYWQGRTWVANQHIQKNFELANEYYSDIIPKRAYTHPKKSIHSTHTISEFGSGKLRHVIWKI